MTNREKNEIVRPITITMKSGDVYTLEFDRDTVKFAEARGFDIADVARFPMTKLPELFFYAFRMHHKNVSREKTDRILFEELKGLPDGAMERLGQLYAAPYESLNNKVEDGDEKNAGATMDF